VRTIGMSHHDKTETVKKAAPDKKAATVKKTVKK
jgi:hypothetical protein